MTSPVAMTRTARDAHAARIAVLQQEAARIVATGRCPVCGAGLHQNLAITGWWQCDRSGSDTFRRDKTGAHCTFQTFTE